MKMTFLDVTTTDPAWNLALEQYVFEQLPRDRGYFLLWQNDNAIIIGRHQNTLAEIHESYVNQNGIRVVRRLSGGGAVYHDLGNLNFTYIVDAGDTKQVDMKLFCQPIAQALSALGARAEVNGRNDILLDGKKISGNAQYVREGRVMHHGTILFDSDLTVVSKALAVNPEKMAAKGVKSVRSRVTNVRPYLQEGVTLAQFKAELVLQLFQEADMEVYTLSEADKAAIAKIQAERYDTWQWNYGASPLGTVNRRRRFEGCGTIQAQLTVEKGVITAAVFTGDFFSTLEPEGLAEKLVGVQPTRAAMEKALKDENIGLYFTGLSREQLLELLLEG